MKHGQQYQYIYLLNYLLKPLLHRRQVQQLHSHLITTGTIQSSYTLWSNLLRHYSVGDFPHEALLLYKLQNFFCQLGSFPYAFLIKSCANLQLFRSGAQLHALTIESGFESHVYVQTALVDMYIGCGCFPEAYQVFDEMPQRNSVSWNVLITGFTKWGHLGLARGLFDKMPDKTFVSWTGIIDGYTRMNQPSEALALFRSMLAIGKTKPTPVTLLTVFPAIWNLGCLELCESVHTYGDKNGFYLADIRVTNALIDAYSRCGSIENAVRVFEGISIKRRNLVSWTTIISAFAMHGIAKEALDYFWRMRETCMKPNQVTFLSILNACSHGGLVEEGLKLFKIMINDFRIKPDIKHYGCLVDMLGRAGRLREAEEMALEIPAEIVNDVIWRTLLGACRYHNDVEMGKRVSKQLFEMEKGYASDYILLSNIFSGVGEYADSEKLGKHKKQTTRQLKMLIILGHSFTTCR